MIPNTADQISQQGYETGHFVACIIVTDSLRCFLQQGTTSRVTLTSRMFSFAQHTSLTTLGGSIHIQVVRAVKKNC